MIRSNHIHLLARNKDDNLSDVIRDLKRHTSKKTIEAIEKRNESRGDWLLFGFPVRSKRS
ncbi:MAG: hypothetical protein HC905_12490 [Bacteroidales bacterium]|nr:hypothetical protein [Bacteroidales bacterium]